MESPLYPTNELFLVELTFVPATSVTDLDGSSDEPTITIYADDENYAFPLLTDKIASIYRNILLPFLNWEMIYSPEKVIILVPISDLNDIDILRDQTNFDVTEGEEWGDLTLDDETRIFFDPDLVDGGDILYIPYLDDIRIFKKGKTGQWESF